MRTLASEFYSHTVTSSSVISSTSTQYSDKNAYGESKIGTDDATMGNTDETVDEDEFPWTDWSVNKKQLCLMISCLLCKAVDYSLCFYGSRVLPYCDIKQ